jgi:hypothetical protein
MGGGNSKIFPLSVTSDPNTQYDVNGWPTVCDSGYVTEHNPSSEMVLSVV